MHWRAKRNSWHLQHCAGRASKPKRTHAMHRFSSIRTEMARHTPPCGASTCWCKRNRPCCPSHAAQGNKWSSLPGPPHPDRNNLNLKAIGFGVLGSPSARPRTLPPMPVGFFRDEAFGLLTFVQASMLRAAFLSARLENSSTTLRRLYVRILRSKLQNFRSKTNTNSKLN